MRKSVLRNVCVRKVHEARFPLDERDACPGCMQGRGEADPADASANVKNGAGRRVGAGGKENRVGSDPVARHSLEQLEPATQQEGLLVGRL
jgi:hypothetical protein